MSERTVFFKNRFIPESEAQISVYDSGLMFGDCIFEMTRSFGKEQFMLQEHVDRLYASAKCISLKIPMTKEEMINHAYEVVELNDPLFASNDEHRLMINVYRGALSIYHGVQGTEPDPYVVITDFPLRWTVRGMGNLFDVGINAVIPHQRSIPAQLLDPKIKSRSRMHLQMANIEVSKIPGDNWALLTDPDGFITEGTGDNFFIVIGNTLITPEPRNILRGISRDYVMDIARNNLKMDVVERNIEPYDVMNADEAFMTGTPMCMLPVTSLNGFPIGNGFVGYWTSFLLDFWGRKVGVDIKNQIKDWNKEDGEPNSGNTPYQFQS